MAFSQGPNLPDNNLLAIWDLENGEVKFSREAEGITLSLRAVDTMDDTEGHTVSIAITQEHFTILKDFIQIGMRASVIQAKLLAMGLSLIPLEEDEYDFLDGSAEFRLKGGKLLFTFDGDPLDGTVQLELTSVQFFEFILWTGLDKSTREVFQKLQELGVNLE